MSIFSRVKKAKKAAEDHKKAAAADTEPKPPPKPYKHVPTHAAQDALAATPTSFSPEEARVKIAAARRRKSEMNLSSLRSSHQSYNHSRDSSEISFSHRPLPRTRSNLSINALMKEASRPQAYPHSLPVHGRQAAQSSEDYSLHPAADYRTFPNPRDVLMPPPKRQRSYQNLSRKSFMTRRKSPLSNISMEEEPEEYFSSSSQDSAFSSTSETSDTSKRNIGNRSMSKRPSLYMSKYIGEKPQPIVEVSLPSSSEDEVKSAINTIPTWKYESYNAPAPTAAPAKATHSTHSRKSSFSSLFNRRGSSVAAS